MRRLTVAGLLAAVILLLAAVMLSLPPPAIEIDRTAWHPRLPGTVVRGAYHVHTRRSDGSGTLDSVGRAAGRAGLDFVVLADHGDATTTPEPPSLRSGVLVVDGVEISTTGGHYVALGLPAAPYPLAGEPAAVVEDVARLGGFGIAAHPDSPKRQLAWEAWNQPLDGFEWLNADTEWRNESGWRLLQTLAHYPIRPVETLAALFERPATTLARWDRLSSEGRRLVALGAADAHARLGVRRETDPYGEGLALELPSYETAFRVFSLSVELDRPFSGIPADDARQLLDAVRRGRIFTTIDGLARGGRLEFWAQGDGRLHRMGELVPGDTELRFTVRAATPAGAEIRLLANGQPVAVSTGVELVHDAPAAAERPGLTAYRVEVVGVSQTDRDLPWIVTNPIFVGREAVGTGRERDTPRHDAPEAEGTRLGGSADVAGWRIEKDPGSTGMMLVPVEALPGDATLEFGIATGSDEAWVAAVHPLPPGVAEAPWNRVTFRARAEQPMRVSVQLRAPTSGRDQRWQRSIYLDSKERVVSLALADLQPVRSADPSIPRANADSLLFVVDRTNSHAGARGRVWLSDIMLSSRTRSEP